MYSLWAYNVCIYALLVWIILIIKDFRVCLTYVTRVYKVRLLFTFSFNTVANFLFLFSLTKNPQNALPPQLLLIVIRNNEIGRKRKKEFYATSRKIIQNREREKKKKEMASMPKEKKKKKENSISVRNCIFKLWLTPPVKKQSNKIPLSPFLILFTLALRNKMER